MWFSEKKPMGCVKNEWVPLRQIISNFQDKFEILSTKYCLLNGEKAINNSLAMDVKSRKSAFFGTNGPVK